MSVRAEIRYLHTADLEPVVPEDPANPARSPSSRHLA